eukprot:CAMPEP_0185831372 /NCGR_PEP_ID=MMETSP1353-20130828/1452_1 /TAXON_ID=1077150 /ORGANISM="Erythrolobus australicus, Strain CCMP3124" /LENGTH=264 /DNA_ID=CAMNT_0028529425 /DNA_START=86 /DNA_END=880 /DNA_ORIENTATION=-
MSGDGAARRRLRDGFDDAQLPVKVCATAQDFSKHLVDSGGAFLMDIDKSRKSRGKNERNEVFKVFMGHEDNGIELLDTDRALRQAVLRVHEPEHAIRVQQNVWSHAERKFKVVETTHTTIESQRWFLLGMDEMHLFVAQLDRPASTVAQARANLRPKSLRNRNAATFKRQGEWFLTPVDRSTAARLDALDPRSIKHNVGLGTTHSGLTGRPHVVSSLAVLDNVEYALGDVCHPDHKTKTLSQWHRVAKNTETAAPSIKGLRWVD